MRSVPSSSEPLCWADFEPFGECARVLSIELSTLVDLLLILLSFCFHVLPDFGDLLSPLFLPFKDLIIGQTPCFIGRDARLVDNGVGKVGIGWKLF